MKKRGIAFITLIYWFLLLYIVAALVYWFIVLEQQNNMMAELRTIELKKNTPDFAHQLNEIELQHRRKMVQYIGEGSTFLVLIIVGALFVYRAVRKHIILSRQQQNFMMAVTHELKTPIAITRLNLETLQKRTLEPQQRQKLIGNALQETDRLNTLTNNILVASQLETGTYRLNIQQVDLGQIAEETAHDFRRRFATRVIETATQENVLIEGEAALLQLLASNLVDNALKYSAPGRPVKVTVAKNEKNAVLTVEDQGQGIPDGEKKKVFQKFYRMGSEATRNAKGTGLGLYLCARIVKDHHGKIEVADNKPAGTVFKVLLKAL